MPRRERLRAFARHAAERSCVLRSLKVSLVVGTVLALINHYDLVVGANITVSGLAQILLSYVVPFSVSTFSSASQAMSTEELVARHPSRANILGGDF